MLLYHRCQNLEDVVYREIAAYPDHKDPDNDESYKRAYKWLADHTGFWPLFLSVGSGNDSIYITGYDNQWRIKIVDALDKKRRKYRKKGGFPNMAMFSFQDLSGVFSDYDYWHYVLNSHDCKITDYEKRLIFKPSYTKARWLLKAKKNPGSVQLVVPKLYLPDAKRVWVRNKKTKKYLEKMGFENVQVKRLQIRW